MKDMLKDRVIAAIGDAYDVGDELGRGGMSVVYRALDLRLMRHVAIKVLPPEFAYDDGIRERFRREAQMAAQLNHPNIIPIFSVDERDGIVYFAMAVCEGESLALRLSRTSRPPLGDVSRILCEVAGALAYAHGKGVVHRDIKPDNILIERDSGRALVTDFGIARAVEGGARLTVTGIAMGTPAYMSPEQAMGDHELDGRSDIYSLGALAYQMISGVTPYTASNAPSMLLKHVSEELVPLVQRRADVPPRLAAVVERALQKKREHRWQTANEMHDALRGCSDASVREGDAPRHAARNAPSVSEPQSVRAAVKEVQRAAQKSREPGRRDAGPTYRSQSPRPTPSRSSTPRSLSAANRDRDAYNRDQREAQNANADWFEGWRNLQSMEMNRHIRAVRRLVPLSIPVGVFTLGMTIGVLLEGIPEFEIGLFWATGITASAAVLTAIRRRVRWLREHGVTMHAALTARKTVSYLPERIPGQLPSGYPVSYEVMNGPYGALVRGAMQDKASVEAAMANLPAMDKNLLPEVLPTVKALAERVYTLVPTLHDLDRDLGHEDIARLEERIAEMEARGGSGESSRTLQLLRRQHATLLDLTRRRDVLMSQVESAVLLLQNIRLDLRKVGSSGMQASMHDVNSATQEARALSREIGHVLSAADDLRKM